MEELLGYLNSRDLDYSLIYKDNKIIGVSFMYSVSDGVDMFSRPFKVYFEEYDKISLWYKDYKLIQKPFDAYHLFRIFSNLIIKDFVGKVKGIDGKSRLDRYVEIYRKDTYLVDSSEDSSIVYNFGDYGISIKI